MSCLSCVTAHRRGGLWFCSRCGREMLVQPVSGQESPPSERSTHPSGRARSFVFRGNTGPVVLRASEPSGGPGGGPREGALGTQKDAPYAVILDLTEARRVRQAHTF